MKLTGKASGPTGAPAAASQEGRAKTRLLSKWAKFRSYWHKQWSQIPEWSPIHPSRVFTAAAVATLFFAGATELALHHMDRTGSWNQVFTNGTYVGLVPNRDDVNFRMEAIAKGYHVDISTIPIHTAVSPGYDWHRVANIPTPAYAIQLDSHSLVSVKSQFDANRVLNDVRQALTPAGVAPKDVKFQGNVGVSPVMVAIADVIPVQSATYRILHPANATLGGRSGAIDAVAKRKSAVAQTPAGSRQASLLEVVADKTITQNSETAFPVRYISDSHLAKGTVKVEHHGVSGLVKRRVHMHYVDGRLVSKSVESSVIVHAAKPEIAIRGTNAGVADGNWGWPSPLTDVTSGFGWRTIGGWHNFHPGIDIGCPIGTPVLASNNGVVEEAGWNSGGYGNWAKINNGDGIETVYGHMSRVVVHAGQVIPKGEIIGYSGATGNVTGPHLHYEVRINGTPVNPGKYM